MAPGSDEMTKLEPEAGNAELRRLHSEADALEHDIRDMAQREHRHENLVARLRRIDPSRVARTPDQRPPEPARCDSRPTSGRP